jgi:hypothetical protein
MPRRQHILKSLASGVPVPVLAGDTDPTLACCAARAILVGMDIEPRREINGAVFEIVGMHIDHQCAPIPFPRFTSHHVEVKPTGRRPIKIFGRLVWSPDGWPGLVATHRRAARCLSTAEISEAAAQNEITKGEIEDEFKSVPLNGCKTSELLIDLPPPDPGCLARSKPWRPVHQRPARDQRRPTWKEWER